MWRNPAKQPAIVKRLKCSLRPIVTSRQMYISDYLISQFKILPAQDPCVLQLLHFGCEGLPGNLFTMDQADLFRPVTHPPDEIYQVSPVGVGRIAAECMHPGADGVAAAIEDHVSAPGAEDLNIPSRRPGGLITHKQHVGTRVAEQRLEIIDDAAAAAHAAGGDHHARPGGLAQVGHGVFMVGMAVDGGQLVEGKGVTSGPGLLPRLGVPEGEQPTVGLGEAARQGRVDDDFQIVPRKSAGGPPVTAVMDDFLQFVEKFLGAADGEGRNQHHTPILKGSFNYLLQLPASLPSTFVEPVTIGGFQDQDVGTVRRAGGREQRRIGGAQVAGENHSQIPETAGGKGVAPGTAHLNKSRAEDMAGRLETNRDSRNGVRGNLLPGAERERGQQRCEPGENAPDETLVAADADLYRVFQHQGEEHRGRFGAVDGAVETGGE